MTFGNKDYIGDNMIPCIPDDKLIQLGEDVARLRILDVASMKFHVCTQSITFHPKITYTAQAFKEVVEDVAAVNKSDQYYMDHLGWGFGPDDLTEDQLKLEYALLLAIWERVDLTMTYGDDGWEYVIGGNPNYCPIYGPAKKLWDALHTSKTQPIDDDETHIEEINGRVYVRKGCHEDGFDSWADALNAIIEKQGDERDDRPTDDVIKTLEQLYCKATKSHWTIVGSWRIEFDHPKVTFIPSKTKKVTDNDLELVNQILKHGVACGEFDDPMLSGVFYDVPYMILKDLDNNIIRRVIAGMFIALATNAKMDIRHCGEQWKISLDTHTPEAYVNLCNIAEIC